jgi:hypothetical protein
MKIVRLDVENVMRLRAVRIEPDPDGNLVVIGGKNGAGKTSVLDSIAMALGGKGAIPPKPVRAGKKSAKIVARLGDLTVTRTISPDGTSRLVVKDAEGKTQKAPQTILDELVGTLSFDPLEFARMAPRAQAEQLQGLVGLDFDDLDERHEEVYAVRRDQNRDVRNLQSQIEEHEIDPSAPAEEVSAADLIAELEQRQDHNAEGERLHREVQGKDQDYHDADADVKTASRKIAEAKKALKKLESEKAKLESERVKSKKEWEKARELFESFAPVDEDEIKEQVRSAEKINATVRHNKEHVALQERLDAAQDKAEDSDRDLRIIADEREERLAAAAFPVDGLGFDENGVTFNGIPFEQASAAEAMRVSVAMGLAANPKLRVLLIRDGSLLDDESLTAIAEQAAAADAQVWIERVGTGEEVTVIIEDGEVAE